MSLKKNLKTRLEGLGAAWSDDSTGTGRKVLATTGAAGGAVGDVVEAVTPDLITQAGTELFNAFGGPQALKFAQEHIPEEYWDEIGDAADSLNLLGVGGAASSVSRHGLLSSMKNYIPGHYGPGRDPVNKLEGMLANKGVPLEAQRKVKGIGQWGGQSALQALENTLVPSARAQLKDTGIPKHVSRQMDTKGGKKSFFDAELDNAQLLYQKYADIQSGRNGGLMPAAEEMVSRMMYQAPENYTPGSVKRAMMAHDSPDTRMTDADYDRFTQFVEKGQGLKEGDKLVIKANRGAGGNHYNDVLKDSQIVSPLFQAFKKLNKKHPDGFSKEDLRAELEVLQKANREKIKDLPEKLRKTKDWFIQEGPGDAVWLSGGRVGSAKTEGGIPFLVKVDTDGNMTGIMADTHDFMEKVPGVGKMVKKKVVATNAPMHNSIYSIRKQLGKESDVPSARQVSKAKEVEGVPLKVDPKTGKEKPGVTDLMLREAVAGAKPTSKTLRNERIRTASTMPLLFEALLEDQE